MTQLDLADLLGISAATVSRAEAGSARLSIDVARRAAEVLDLAAEDLETLTARDTDAPRPVAGQFVRGSGSSWRVFEPLAMGPTLAAALDSFLELGYHGSSVRDVARRADVSVPGLYHHHPSKQALLLAILDLTMADFTERCLAARDEGETPVERFELLVECFALMHSYRRELGFIGASEMRSVEPDERVRLARLRADTGQLITDEVRAIADAGGLDNPHPEDAARAVVTMLVGIANWYRRDGALTPEDIARRYVVHASALIGLR